MPVWMVPSRSGSPPRDGIERPALAERLEEATTTTRLTRVVAPAGSGKSTLLHQWSAGHGGPIGWLGVERRHIDAVRLGHDLVDALRAIDSSVGGAALERLDESGMLLGAPFLEALVDDLARVPESVLVLDDLHNLDNSAQLAELGHLVEASPPQLHFVVASRSDTTLDVARLRVRGEITELRADLLAFEPAAARDLVRRVGRAELTDGQLANLVSRTEGWPAGIYLAALSMRGADDIDKLLDELTGDEHGIARYMTDEVLAHQTPAVRSFLVTTSVLDRLTGSLCDELTGERDGHQMLDALDRDGLFLARLDARRRWYRYQGLFRDLLRSTLEADDPDREATLLRRAAGWHLAEGHIDAAAEYLVSARAWDEVNDLVLRHGRSLWEQGKASSATTWIDAIPEWARSARPTEKLARASLYVMTGRGRPARELIEELDGSARTTPGERLFADFLRCSLVPCDMPPARVIEAADRVLAGLRTPVAREVPDIMGFGLPSSMEIAALVGKGRAELYLRELDPARASLTLAVESDGMAFAPWAVHALGSLALLEAQTGRLQRAEALATRALDVADDAGLVMHTAMTDALIALGRVAVEQRDLDRATHMLDEAGLRAHQHQRPTQQAVHRIEHSLLLLARGESVLGLLASEAPVAAPAPPAGLVARQAAVRIELLLADGQVATARSVLADLDAASCPELLGATVHLAVAQRDAALARRHLDRWPAGGEPGHEVSRLLGEAAVAALVDDRAGARAFVADAVAIAEPEGALLAFGLAGDGVAVAVRSLAERSPSPFLTRIVTSLAEPAQPPATGDLVEPLTEREMAVLRYLTRRMSNEEIAAALFVSRNTLKSHIKHIYWKLGVNRRDDAVRAGERLGLI